MHRLTNANLQMWLLFLILLFWNPTLCPPAGLQQFLKILWHLCFGVFKWIFPLCAVESCLYSVAQFNVILMGWLLLMYKAIVKPCVLVLMTSALEQIFEYEKAAHFARLQENPNAWREIEIFSWDVAQYQSVWRCKQAL